MQNNSEFPLSAHGIFRFNRDMVSVYTYDRADDGPEVRTIKAVRASHTPEDLALERTIGTLHGRL